MADVKTRRSVPTTHDREVRISQHPFNSDLDRVSYAAVLTGKAEAQDATLTTTARRIGPIREAINRIENLRGLALGVTGIMEIEFDRVFGAVEKDAQPETDHSDLPDAEVAQLHIHITSLENAMRRLYQQGQRAQDL